MTGLHEYLTPIGSGVFLLIFGGLVRWGVKIDRSLSGQAVINEKVVGTLNVLAERLNGHEELDEARERRIDKLESHLASLPARSYSRGRK